MQRATHHRSPGCYRVLRGHTFLATSDSLWHAQHLAQRRLGRVLEWRTEPDPAYPECPRAVADDAGVPVSATWLAFGAHATAHIPGPGHLGA